MFASQEGQIFFSSPRRPETHCRHAQDHQRASSLTGSIKIFQSTVIMVYEVEHQMTVNTKHGKQVNWFSELIKEFHDYLQINQVGRHTTVESKVALHSRSLSIDIPKSYGLKVQVFSKNRPEWPSN